MNPFVHPRQETQIRALLGHHCELCGETGPPESLVWHSTGQQGPDPSLSVLLLCRLCDRHLRCLGSSEVEVRLLNQRPFALRKALRRMFGYHPPPYHPPPSPDPADLYREACGLWGLNGSG